MVHHRMQVLPHNYVTTNTFVIRSMVIQKMSMFYDNTYFARFLVQIKTR